MNSMTGCGRGQAGDKNLTVTAEVNSVNRKQLDISIRMPREWDVHESRIRELVSSQVSRGKVNLTLSGQWHGVASDAAPVLDESVLVASLKTLKSWQKKHKISGKVTLDTLLRIPGVIRTVESVQDSEQVWPLMEKALLSSLKQMSQMRAKEGQHLSEDLKTRLVLMREGVTRVKVRLPAVTENYRKNLHQRVKEAGLDISLDEDRLMKEVVFFAERCDVSEELTRLESHFKQFSETLRQSAPVGRTLDFLTQEMNREVNTLGSKANDAEISRDVVLMKSELEKIREQVQNIE